MAVIGGSDQTRRAERAGVVDGPGIVLTPQQVRSRRNRNIAIGLAIGLVAILFYVVTIAKLGPGVLQRPL